MNMFHMMIYLHILLQASAASRLWLLKVTVSLIKVIYVQAVLTSCIQAPPDLSTCFYVLGSVSSLLHQTCVTLHHSGWRRARGMCGVGEAGGQQGWTTFCQVQWWKV